LPEPGLSSEKNEGLNGAPNASAWRGGVFFQKSSQIRRFPPLFRIGDILFAPTSF
jgi:hypothetical protein